MLIPLLGLLLITLSLAMVAEGVLILIQQRCGAPHLGHGRAPLNMTMSEHGASYSSVAFGKHEKHV